MPTRSDHDWKSVDRPSFKERLGLPLSMHIDCTLADPVKTWVCRRCGFSMDTNLPPTRYGKAPDCDHEVVRQVMET